ncbi:MAG: HD-GYP domain-containing protein, partial [Clostridiales bacterium]|nr:HD-GYP domain-containing protein [Clostridiales bacterium]
DMILKNIWALKSFFTLSPLGIMMLLFYSSYGWFGLILFFGPLFVARYSFKLYLNMKNIYLETIVALTKAIDAKDEYTKGHSVRVSEYSVMIGKEMKMSEPRLEILKTAALLHDVGKIGISDNILLKPGKLDDDEMQIIRSHPEMGAKIIDGIEFLDKARLFVSQHHERYDGKGYPFQIKGKDMPAESCIMAVADAFDAMTTDRSYRKGFSEERAMEILIEEKGKQFSPDVVEAMVAIKEKQGSVIIYVD